MGTIWRCHLVFRGAKCAENYAAKSVEWVKFLWRTCDQTMPLRIEKVCVASGSPHVLLGGREINLSSQTGPACVFGGRCANQAVRTSSPQRGGGSVISPPNGPSTTLFLARENQHKKRAWICKSLSSKMQLQKCQNENVESVCLRRSTPNKHLETALQSHVCMVDRRRCMVLDLMFQPKFRRLLSIQFPTPNLGGGGSSRKLITNP
jgi:hypothetical protein